MDAAPNAPIITDAPTDQLVNVNATPANQNSAETSANDTSIEVEIEDEAYDDNLAEIIV